MARLLCTRYARADTKETRIPHSLGSCDDRRRGASTRFVVSRRFANQDEAESGRSRRDGEAT